MDCIDRIKEYLQERKLGAPVIIEKVDVNASTNLYFAKCDNDIRYYVEIHSDDSISITQAPDFSKLVKNIKLPKELASVSRIKVPSFTVSPNFVNAIQTININANEIMKSMVPALKTFSEIASEAMKKIIDNREELSKAFENIKQALKPLRAIGILASNQIVYWDHLDSTLIEELINCGDNTSVEIVMEDYFSNDENFSIQKITDDTLYSLSEGYISNIYQQSIFLFNNEKYELSIVGMFVVVDYLLSFVSGNATTAISKRANEILSKLENNEEIDSTEYALLSLIYTFEKTTEVISARASFKEDTEPVSMNRHWLLHGRSERVVTRFDCVKMINYVYSIIIIKSLTSE